MSRLLLSLHQVPADEIEAIEALLADAGIGHYRTPASRWGLGSGALWLAEAGDHARARGLLDTFQQQRAASARADLAAARAAGQAPTMWTLWRERPLAMLLLWLGLLAVLALGVLPFLWMMRGEG